MSKDRHCLLGIAEAIQAIEIYTENFESGDGLFFSKIHFDAVLMNFVVIGEMVEKISDVFKNSHTEVDWVEIKDMRNIIAHNYFGVDAEEIWQIIQKDIPELKEKINILIKGYSIGHL